MIPRHMIPRHMILRPFLSTTIPASFNIFLYFSVLSFSAEDQNDTMEEEQQEILTKV